MKKDLVLPYKLDREKSKSKKMTFRLLKITIVIQKVTMMKYSIYDILQTLIKNKF